MIIIANNGPQIASTNFWQTPLAAAGKIYCSCNAGAVRILLPSALREVAEEWNGCEYVIISRGPWPAMHLAEAVELLFEDRGDSPYALHLSPESFDALPGDPGGKEWRVSAWLPGPTCVFDRSAKWRRVKIIPCLEEWHI